MSKRTQGFITVLLLLLTTFCSNASAQHSISGEEQVNVNVSHIYTLIAPGAQNITWTLGDALTTNVGPNYSWVELQWPTYGEQTFYVTYTISGVTYNTMKIVNVADQITPGVIAPAKTQWTRALEHVSIQEASPMTSGACTPENVTYRWEYSYDNITFQLIPGATYRYFEAKEPILQTTYFRRGVQCLASGSFTVFYSNVITISPLPSLTGGTVAASQSLTPSASPQAFTGQTSPSGGTGTYTFQWEQSGDGVTWASIPGATNVGYQASSASVTTFFRRKVISGEQLKYSNTVKLTPRSAATLNKPAITAASGTATVKNIPDLSSVQQQQLNEISEYTVTRPGITSGAAVPLLNARTDVRKISNYFDGQGKKVQEVIARIGYTGKDLVSPIVYDQFGIESDKFLPYFTSETGSPGAFKPTVSTDQFNYFKGIAPDENYFYSTATAEKAEFSRAKTVYSPGISRAGTLVGKSSFTRYNTSEDKVRIWEIGDDAVAYPASTAIYEPGMLTVIESVNEHGESVTEYQTKSGNMICRSVKSATVDNDEDGLRTYYVYNDFRQMRYLISPEATRYCRINNIWDFNASESARITAKHLCSKYVFDKKGRIVRKQLAGVDGEELFIYDVRGRLIFAQNALMRNSAPGEWLYYTYDGLDRPLFTAIYKNSSATFESLSNLALTANGSTSQTITYPTAPDIYVDLRTGSPAVYEATNSVTLLSGFESEENAEFQVQINAQPQLASDAFPVHNPVPGITPTEVLSVMHYDDYSWAGARPFNSNFQLTAGSNSYAEPVTPAKHTVGKITGVSMLIRGVNKMQTTTIYYDALGREIQRLAENVAGATDITTSQYDFGGKLLSRYLHHRNPRSAGTPELKILNAYTYENGGFLKEIKQTIFGPVNSTKVLSSFTYDERGQTKTQTLGNIETLEFDYDFLGRATGINAAYARNKTGQHFFGMELSYERGFEIPRRDGGLSGVTWRRKGNDDEWHANGFLFDHASRLTRSDYTQNEGGAWTTNQADYKTEISEYDDNGNIRRMKQEGMLPGNVKAGFDDLTYQYQNNNLSNKLASVSDAKGNMQQGDFKDGTNSGNDYTYDADGNMTRDLNRGLSVQYDYLLNKPVKITLDSDPSKSIEYIYNAGGEKLQQIVKSGTTTTTYSYVDGIVYKNDELMLVSNELGRARKGIDGTFVYDYFIKDHLGNVRTVITEETSNIYYRASHEDNPQPTPVIPERNSFSFAVEPEAINAGHKFYDYNGTNRKYVRLNATDANRKIGTSKVLRVMAGDAIQTAVMSYYQQNNPANNVPNLPVNNILTQLTNALLGPTTTVVPNGHGNLLQGVGNGITMNTTDFSTFINNNQQQHPSSEVPKAYLNYVLFDDNFKMVNGGAVRVSTPDALAPLVGQINVNKNGYVYIYLSNESPTNVYFDDLVVQHTTGPLLQEDAYYAFGMPIKALSSRALNRLKNDYTFNGIEKLSEFDLDIYDALYRNLDPQIGRWWQRDPKAESYPDHSPYNLSGNNPAHNTDPLGDDWFQSQKSFSFIWKDSHESSLVINGELMLNIGPVLTVIMDKKLYSYEGPNLLYIKELVTGNEHVFFDKGQRDYVKWFAASTQQSVMAQLQESIFQKKLAMVTPYEKEIFGGVQPGTVDRLRKEVRMELIPTLKHMYAATRAKSSSGPLYNRYRREAITTRAEAWAAISKAGISVTAAWITGGSFSTLQYTARTTWGTAELASAKVASETVELKFFSGVEKAWGSGATPNSMYTYIAKSDGKAVSNYIYNSEGKVIYQVDFAKHAEYLSGHGHQMKIPGNLGSGHQGLHIPHWEVPPLFHRIPNGVEYSTPIGF